MSGRGPVLRRRQIGTLAAGAAAVGALPAMRIPSASAADASTFVSGFGLPLNLDQGWHVFIVKCTYTHTKNLSMKGFLARPE